jgi:ribosomal protein S18 acetylase RimI-like enzyme
MAVGRQALGPEAVVRTCRRDEIPVVLALWSAADTVPTPSDDAASLRRLLDGSADALLVAEVGGRMVGTLIAAWDGWRGNLYRLAVLPAYRRRGIARELVREGERRLADKGAVRVSALVYAEHEPAVGLWLAVGYHRDVRVGRFAKSLVVRGS